MREREPTGDAVCQFLFLTFFGSQTSAFFLTTAPQSSQRYLPDLGLTFDFPLRQLIQTG